MLKWLELQLKKNKVEDLNFKYGKVKFTTTDAVIKILFNKHIK